ncbi:L-2-hydroxyglutarate oxidase [Sulfurovum sp. XTW-4]|uniref:L-2-hydroxyglutarate oxidase n=1 Tax=Sulfurovum xiamenensis TaxID=3019066 RepID=A0ABT7QNF7_9BACT|nr:L-2-hydroxyglutarate oxidase [Sulfurovum xiamenensis]MDM5262587.1 L-2-hydroxyglutarate oxidase [Sulfurovum xiamenensis]
MSNIVESDYLIIGAGIIGLAIAKELHLRYPERRIIVLEKESKVAEHSSGRNSGVLHAGFYYTANSLKAKFTRDGNRILTKYCDDNNLRINKCHKVVVASDEKELEGIYELERRGKVNGVNVRIIDEEELATIEPNAKTYKKALYSPDTSTVDPVEITTHVFNDMQSKGVQFYFKEGYHQKIDDHTVESTLGNRYHANKIINCAGLYADKIARDYGYSEDYVIIPFKGIYLKYTKEDKPIKTNIYPVPNLNNPFLGVHYTVTVDNIIKIGPTAIPAFWRENYKGLSRFSFSELLTILRYETKLFLNNSFNFRSLAYEELHKYNKKYFVSLATKMVKQIDVDGFNQWSKPGIRAQLLNIKTLELLQDFVVEGDTKTVHVLNAVSPAFTSSFPFAKWVVDHYIEKDEV